MATVSLILFKMLVPWTSRLADTETEYAEVVPVSVGPALETFAFKNHPFVFSCNNCSFGSLKLN